MELVALVRELSRRRALAVAMLLVAALAAVATAYKLPSMEKRSLAVGAATGQILVDSDPSTLVSGAGTDQIAALGGRARVYAQYLSSRDAVGRVSQQTGIPARLITARGPFSQGTGISNYDQQPAESRAKDLTDEGKHYRLVFEAQEDVPIITVYSTGPTADAALKLAKSSFATLEGYVADLKRKGTAEGDSAPRSTGATAGPDDVVVRELGEPEAGVVGGGASLSTMVMAFIAALGVQIVLAAIVLRYREQSRRMREGAASALEPVGDPAGAAPAAPDAAEEHDPRWRPTYVRG